MIAPAEPTITWKSVLPEIEDTLGGKYNGQNATLEYLIQPDGSVALTHVVQIQNEETNEWFEAFIDAHSGKLISVTDFVSHASVRCLPSIRFSILLYSDQNRPVYRPSHHKTNIRGRH
jgi:extracellular elastinolytic metalloproteinase